MYYSMAFLAGWLHGLSCCCMFHADVIVSPYGLGGLSHESKGIIACPAWGHFMGGCKLMDYMYDAELVGHHVPSLRAEASLVDRYRSGTYLVVSTHEGLACFLEIQHRSCLRSLLHVLLCWVLTSVCFHMHEAHGMNCDTACLCISFYITPSDAQGFVLQTALQL